MIKIKVLLFLFLMMFSIALSCFGYSFYNEFKRNAESNVRDNLYNDARYVESIIQHEVDAAIDQTIYLSKGIVAADVLRDTGKSDRIQQALNSIKVRSSLVQDICMVATSGKIKVCADGTDPQILDSIPSIKKMYNTLAYSSSKNGSVGSVSVIKSSKVIPYRDDRALLYIYPVIDNNSRASSVRGFILMTMPFEHIRSVRMSDHDLHGSNIRIDVVDMPAEPDSQAISKKIQLTNHDGTPMMSLWISISQSYEHIDEIVTDAILNQVQTNLVVSAIIGAMLLALFLIIMHSFSKLFTFISEIERFKTVNPKKFWLWEFATTSSLLLKMKETITSQVTDIRKKNLELASKNKEVVDANSRLASMNSTLEDRIKERTQSLQKALALSNTCNNISNVIINQRSKLKDDLDEDSVLKIFVDSIKQFNLNLHYYLNYKIEGEKEQHASTMECFVPRHAFHSTESYRCFNGFYYFPLTMNEGVGQLIIKPQEETLEIDILTNITVFCREVSSYLDTRVLRNRLNYWAKTDGLTNLGNRVAFDQEFNFYETSLDSEVGLFLIDVNGLKEMNDKRGHAAGDALLKNVAEKLRTVFSDYSANVFRIGGDEFVVLLHQKDLDKSDEIIKKLEACQGKEETIINDTKVIITFATGFADSRRVPFKMLYKQADKNMYINKEAHYEQLKRLYGIERHARK